MLCNTANMIGLVTSPPCFTADLMAEITVLISKGQEVNNMPFTGQHMLTDIECPDGSTRRDSQSFNNLTQVDISRERHARHTTHHYSVL